MPLIDRVRRFLDERGVAYEVLPHREAFTAQGVAAASHVSGKQMAKVLIAKDPAGGHVMVVLPAACRLNLEALREAARQKDLSLAPEDEVARLFPDCEVGAMPPFGNLYDMTVMVDSCLAEAETILFQAGNHHEVVRMTYSDYASHVKPAVGEICRH